MTSELDTALLEDETLLEDEALLENLVGLHLIEEVREFWVCGRARGLNDEHGELTEEHLEALRGEPNYDEENEEYDIEGDADETLIFLVRIDGEEHALFNRGAPMRPVLGATRQRSMAWPFSPHGLDPGFALQNDTAPFMCNLFWRPDSDLPLTGKPDRVLVAVDETKDRIVLEIGVERYAYQVPNDPLRILIPLQSGPRVLPGHSLRVTSMTQQGAFRTSRLIIGINPDRWVVENIRLEGKNQIIGEIPGGVFSSSAAFTPLMLPAIQPGQIMEFTVRYAGEERHGEPFIAALLGEVPSSCEPVTHIGRRYVARWTPEGRFEPWLAGIPSRWTQNTGEDLPSEIAPQ